MAGHDTIEAGITTTFVNASGALFPVIARSDSNEAIWEEGDNLVSDPCPSRLATQIATGLSGLRNDEYRVDSCYLLSQAQVSQE